MILLWGLPADSPLAAVSRALTARAVPHLLLDQRDVLGHRVGEGRGRGVPGSPRAIDLSTVTSAYLRPYDTWRVPAVARACAPGPALRHASAVAATVFDWADVTSALVVNRPRCEASNASKPHQARLIERAGLAVPESLVTNDPAALGAFLDRHGDVIYKSTSGVRSTVALVDRHDARRWERLGTCPTLFQRYLDGDDVRVHVVGGRWWATRITTTAVDYRRPGRAEVVLEETSLPADVAVACVGVTADLGLLVSGIDLRQTSDGGWYAFEVNPSPAFTCYPRADEVAAAIAELLAAGRP